MKSLFNLVWDMYSAFTLILMALIMIIISQVNPKAKPTEDSAKPPGQMMLCIYWSGRDDVDLWFRPPGQAKATGYSNKNGGVADLVKDDLGTTDGPHYECQFASSLPDGLWVANLHGYSITDPVVSVHAEIRLSGPDGFKLLFETTLDIRQKQERTIAQFRMVGGQVVPDSLNQVYVGLRSAQ